MRRGEKGKSKTRQCFVFWIHTDEKETKNGTVRNTLAVTLFLFCRTDENGFIFWSKSEKGFRGWKKEEKEKGFGELQSL